MRRQHSFAAFLIGKSSLLKEGLAKILRSAEFRVLASVPRADDLIASKVPAHTLFLVVHTGDEFGAAIEQIEILRKHHPHERISIVADHYRLDQLVSAFRAGASGYFVELMTCDAFIKSLELVMMGETVFPPAFFLSVLATGGDRLDEADQRDAAVPMTDIEAEDTLSPQLSPRERAILRCLIEGDSNKCIARKLEIAEATVKVHVKAILRKIRVQNRTQAAIWGMNNRLLARPNKSPVTADAGGADVPDVRRIEAPPLGMLNHQINHAPHAIGKSMTQGLIRLRK